MAAMDANSQRSAIYFGINARSLGLLRNLLAHVAEPNSQERLRVTDTCNMRSANRERHQMRKLEVPFYFETIRVSLSRPLGKGLALAMVFDYWHSGDLDGKHRDRKRGQ